MPITAVDTLRETNVYLASGDTLVVTGWGSLITSSFGVGVAGNGATTFRIIPQLLHREPGARPR